MTAALSASIKPPNVVEAAEAVALAVAEDSTVAEEAATLAEAVIPAGAEDTVVVAAAIVEVEADMVTIFFP